MANGESIGDRPGGGTAQEPGEVENRLSLNPNDPDFVDTIGDWEDGNEYTLSNVKVRQISPGEFEVLSMDSGTPSDDAESSEASPDAENPSEDQSEMGMSDNPAVRRMMTKR